MAVMLREEFSSLFELSSGISAAADEGGLALGVNTLLALGLDEGTASATVSATGDVVDGITGELVSVVSMPSARSVGGEEGTFEDAAEGLPLRGTDGDILGRTDIVGDKLGGT